MHIVQGQLAEPSEPNWLSRTSVNRDRQGAHDRLVRDYFADNCLYDNVAFKRRFRLSRNLFNRICKDLDDQYPYFQLCIDARGRLGFSPIQKCTTALRYLAYDITADGTDEYLQNI